MPGPATIAEEQAMKRALSTIVILLGLIASGSYADSPELVIVCSSRSPATQMTAAEARRLFLGLPLQAGKQTLKPVRNVSDAHLNEVFLQRIMFMSAEDYERRIEARVNRSGGSRPPSYESLPGLIGTLQRDPLAVTYMWRREAGSGSGLKIIGER